MIRWRHFDLLNMILKNQILTHGGISRGSGMVSKRELSEQDICNRYITPALQNSGWDLMTQIRTEYSFTDGRISISGQKSSRGKRKRADYLLSFEENLPIAVIEAKENKKPMGGGLQQAMIYAEMLEIPFVFSSNGDGFVFHDRTGQSIPVERNLKLEEFPTPDELWSKYRAWKGITDEIESVVKHPYYTDGTGKEPRYYQRIAIQRVVEAVARGKKRALLTMATGTGKTYTAFQIIWRLLKARKVKRVLFLADRNILIDQSRTNDFKPFGGIMTKVKNRTVDKSYEIYLALYQALAGNDEQKDIYKQFSPDFFDLVVVDECHRGSAREESAWREILDHFSSAVHLGLTATPKEKKHVSTTNYFGESVYTYSLKQGIDDGFLAPYKVVRIDLDRDLIGWRPSAGMVDDLGQNIEDRVYNQRDMDKTLVLNQRTNLVAKRVVEYMVNTDTHGKCIVFCEDIDHAERMRSALANEVSVQIPEERNNTSKFVVRITGDTEEGKRALEPFIHPEERYPVIATTSKLMTTGVDAKTCKLIVLDQRIESMIEFKQIIGRGTRIHEPSGKRWFTIMDFKKATENFADPEWDGEAEVIYEGPEIKSNSEDSGEEIEGSNNVKYRVSGVDVEVIAERVQYFDPVSGRFITESLTDYTRSSVKGEYETLEEFLGKWNSSGRKSAVIEEMEERGLLLEPLKEKLGQDMDPFDIICHIVYDRPPLTRKERAIEVRKRDVFTEYGDLARQVLDSLLDKYADDGIVPSDDFSVLKVDPFSDLGTPVELVNCFGGKKSFEQAVAKLTTQIYA